METVGSVIIEGTLNVIEEAIFGSVIIGGTLNVTEDAIFNSDVTINGNVTINGTINEIFGDFPNIIVINDAVVPLVDTGFLANRSIQDITTDTPTQMGQFNSFGSNNLILDVSASTVNDYYNGWYLKTSSGVNIGNIGKIVAYNGSLRTATFASDFLFVVIPGDTYNLYNNIYNGILYDASNKQFAFCGTMNDDLNNIVIANYLDVVGNTATFTNIYANVVASPSDIKLKYDIVDFDDEEIIYLIKNIKAKKFKWKKDNTHDFGFIAQDIERVLPSVVHTDVNGSKYVSYEKVVPLLINLLHIILKKIDI